MSRRNRQWRTLLDKRIARLRVQAGAIRTRGRLGQSLPDDPETLDLLLDLIGWYESAEVLERNLYPERTARSTRETT